MPLFHAGVLQAMCSMWVTFAGRHMELSPSQARALGGSPAVRVLFFFAVIQLATQDPSLAAYGAFATWLLLDVALDERRGTGLLLDVARTWERVKAYEASKQKIFQY
jgi:hypothetical protein